MTNEMKLLMAFIEASGFEVDRGTDYQETEITEANGHMMIGRIQNNLNDGYKLKLNGGAYVRGDNGSYFRLLSNPVVSYKVTKKELALSMRPACGDHKPKLGAVCGGDFGICERCNHSIKQNASGKWETNNV